MPSRIDRRKVSELFGTELGDLPFKYPFVLAGGIGVLGGLYWYLWHPTPEVSSTAGLVMLIGVVMVWFNVEFPLADFTTYPELNDSNWLLKLYKAIDNIRELQHQQPSQREQHKRLRNAHQKKRKYKRK